MLCVCLVLLPHGAAANPSLAIDLDGDGRHDHVAVDRREPSVLRVWLSASDTTQSIRAGVPLLRFIATDLDGDHRPELIARDTESQIHVWTRKHRRFKPYRAHLAAPVALQRASRHSLDDRDTEPSNAIPGVTWAPFALLLGPATRAPALVASHSGPPSTAPPCRSLTSVDPFLPRPPPPPLAL
jgi:hypothetical protein